MSFLHQPLLAKQVQDKKVFFLPFKISPHCFEKLSLLIIYHASEIEVEIDFRNTLSSYAWLSKKFVISPKDANASKIGECVEISEEDNKSWHRFLQKFFFYI